MCVPGFFLSMLSCWRAAQRASDKEFLPTTTAAFVDLLDWTARQIRAGQMRCDSGGDGTDLRAIGINARPGTAWRKILAGCSNRWPVARWRLTLTVRAIGARHGSPESPQIFYSVQDRMRFEQDRMRFETRLTKIVQHGTSLDKS